MRIDINRSPSHQSAIGLGGILTRVHERNFRDLGLELSPRNFHLNLGLTGYDGEKPRHGPAGARAGDK